MLLALEIPSKCRFDLLQATLEQVENGWDPIELSETIGQHPRQAHFMLQNARILGFVSKVGNEFVLTDLGSLFLRSTDELKGLVLLRAILSCKVFQMLVEYAGSIAAANRMSVDEVSDFLLTEVRVSEMSQKPIQPITARRRASSLKRWVAWAYRNLPRIESEEGCEGSTGNTVKQMRVES